jgi:Holliday junction resolvase
MKTYAKGARSERELLHFFHSKNFSVIRTASSGGTITPVDVVTLKNGKIFAFEIKAWATKPTLERRKLEHFKEWCNRAGAIGFLAWYNKNQWKFLPLKDAAAGRYEDENWLTHEHLLSVIDFSDQ